MTAPGRWMLSPAYDLNPVPEIDRNRTPKTTITEAQEEPGIAVLPRPCKPHRVSASKLCKPGIFWVKFSMRFPAGEKRAGGFVSKPPPWTPAPRRSRTRTCKRPGNSSPKFASFVHQCPHLERDKCAVSGIADVWKENAILTITHLVCCSFLHTSN